MSIPEQKWVKGPPAPLKQTELDRLLRDRRPASGFPLRRGGPFPHRFIFDAGIPHVPPDPREKFRPVLIGRINPLVQPNQAGILPRKGGLNAAEKPAF